MTSLIHIFQCWDQFKRGKHKRKDVLCFERNLEDNLFQLQNAIITLQYQHSSYDHFYITDPKQRYISKASVRDRLVHHIVYAVLNPLFDKIFIFHSLSSRIGKGTHFGIRVLRRMIRQISANGNRPCYALKMDIKRFFDTINHEILKTLIRKKVKDVKALKMIDTIIDSYRTNEWPADPIGTPLGNVTSQLFANIYLHELDDFVKQKLRERYYLRYCDDFIILSNDKQHLQSLIASIQEFLAMYLKLELHPKKVTIRKLSQGIDFVGYVLFSKYTLLRTRTKQRMKKRLKEAYKCYLDGKINAIDLDYKIQSYIGILSHANQHILSQAVKNAYWVRSLQ